MCDDAMLLRLTDENRRHGVYDVLLPYIPDVLWMSSHHNGPSHLRCLDVDHVEVDRSVFLSEIRWHDKRNTCT